jgi:hypothetical protein
MQRFELAQFHRPLVAGLVDGAPEQPDGDFVGDTKES